jgi:aryl-alcohol dehydrogenase-like predicted oxidoreductase
MEHRQLGRTGISVSKFCLGAMMFGAWGNPDHDESVRIIHAALDAGINFIDTADVYAAGESEETLGALTDLVQQGKIRYFGHATFPASRIVEAQWAARERNLQRFVTEQPPYSILVRAIENDVLPTCRRHDMAVIPYSPLTGGWLSGRWRKDAGQQASSRANRLPERFDLANPYNQQKLDAVEQLAQLADEVGITLIQLAIAFVLNHPAITSPLIGPRTMEQLESQLAAADVVLDRAVLDRIDEIVPPGLTINPADNSWTNPDLEPGARRR